MMYILRTLLIGVIGTICCLPLRLSAATNLVDHIVAVVNSDIITRSELDERLALIQKQFAQHALPPFEILQAQVLEMMIQKKSEVQFGAQTGITVTPAQIDQESEAIAKYNGMTLATFREKIKQEGISEAHFRENLHDELVIRQIQQRDLIPTIRITPEEIAHFMKAHEHSLDHTKEYRLGHILISIPNAPSSEQLAQASDKAQLVFKKLQAGDDFAKLAISYSNDAQALKGGDLGWRKLPEVPSLFSEEVKSMHLAEIRGPIRSNSGFHLIKLLEIRTNANTEQPPLTQEKAQQLLLQQKLETRFAHWERDLRANTFVKVLLPAQAAS